MKKLLAILLLLSINQLNAQQLLRANKGWFNTSIQLGSIEIINYNTAVNGTTGAAHNSMPTTKAVFDYVQSSAVLVGQAANSADITGTVTAPVLTSTGVVAGSYGSATQVASVTVDSKGRITGVSATTITGVTPGGTAGGDLTGTYPNPTVDGLQGFAVASTSPVSGQVLKWNGSAWAPGTDNSGGAAANLTSGNTAISVTGGTNAVLVAASLTFNAANVNLGDLGSTLPLAKLAAGTATGHSPRWNGSTWISALDYGSTPISSSNAALTFQDVNGGSTVMNVSGALMETETLAITVASATATFTINLANAARLYLYRNGVLIREGAGNDFTRSGDIVTYFPNLAIGESVTAVKQR